MVKKKEMKRVKKTKKRKKIAQCEKSSIFAMENHSNNITN